MFVQNPNKNKPVSDGFENNSQASHLRIGLNKSPLCFNYTVPDAPSDELYSVYSQGRGAAAFCLLRPDNNRRGSSSAFFH